MLLKIGNWSVLDESVCCVGKLYTRRFSAVRRALPLNGYLTSDSEAPNSIGRSTSSSEDEFQSAPSVGCNCCSRCGRRFSAVHLVGGELCAVVFGELVRRGYALAPERIVERFFPVNNDF